MKNSIYSICLIMAMVIFGNCGGSLSKAQITENVMNILEESVGKTVTIKGYPGSVGRHQGDYQEVITFFPTVGMGSPEGQKFYVIKEIGKLEEPPMKPGAQYQKVGKYRITEKSPNEIPSKLKVLRLAFWESNLL